MVWNAIRATCRRICRSPIALLILVVFSVWLASKFFLRKRAVPGGPHEDIKSYEFENLADFDQHKTKYGWYDIGFRHVDVKPKRDKKTWSVMFKNVAVYAIQGHRDYMEDRFSLISDQNNNFDMFAIFDGHGGSFVADYAERHLLQKVALKLESLKSDANINQVMIDETIALDLNLTRIKDPDLRFVGSTAIFGYLSNDNLYVANLGDCRAVGIRSKYYTVHPITVDHKPNHERELKRIKDSGGSVSFNGVWRLNGILAVSRALGDFYLKKPGWLIAKPDVFHLNLRTSEVDVVLLASDGFWDVFNEEQVIVALKDSHSNGQQMTVTSLMTAAKYLVEEAYRRGSTDNITVMLVKCK